MRTLGTFRNGFGNDSKCKVLLGGEDSEGGGSSFYESSRGGRDGTGHSCSLSGGTSPTRSVTQKKFGNYSWYIENDSSSYIQIGTAGSSSDWDFGSGDFTIDLWAYLYDDGTLPEGDAGIDNPIFGVYLDDDNYQMGMLESYGANLTRFYYEIVESSSTRVYLETNWTSELEQWVHGAIVRKGTEFALYTRGKKIDSAEYSGTLNTISQPYFLGQFRSTGKWYGYFDEFRISKGIARWSNDFTVPGRSYGPIVNTGS